MEERLKRIYVPMTETGFYILFCLQEEMHGYNIGKKVRELTGGEIAISPGTMYGTLSKMEKDGLIIRTVYPVVPPKVEYTLSEFGKSIIPVLDSMCNWGSEYLKANLPEELS